MPRCLILSWVHALLPAKTKARLGLALSIQSLERQFQRHTLLSFLRLPSECESIEPGWCGEQLGLQQGRAVLWVSHSTFLCLRDESLQTTQAQNPAFSTCFPRRPIETHLLALPATTLQAEHCETHDSAEWLLAGSIFKNGGGR